ncbi:MAG TPA: hypothetical protein DEP19_08195 [Anaerolineae bacterium]|nr:hypothetical protein [Anaerolineae bacterium]
MNELIKANINVMKYLGERKNHPAFALPNSVPDPYYQQGSHPDVVERIWDQLGASLPKDCRCLVYGVPALVHPKSGIIFALSRGTNYFLRLSEKIIDEAIKSGAETHIKWVGGGELNVQQELGSDWIIGGWSTNEIEWCKMIFDELNEGS